MMLSQVKRLPENRIAASQFYRGLLPCEMRSTFELEPIIVVNSPRTIFQKPCWFIAFYHKLVWAGSIKQACNSNHTYIVHSKGRGRFESCRWSQQFMIICQSKQSCPKKSLIRALDTRHFLMLGARNVWLCQSFATTLCYGSQKIAVTLCGVYSEVVLRSGVFGWTPCVSISALFLRKITRCEWWAKSILRLVGWIYGREKQHQRQTQYWHR